MPFQKAQSILNNTDKDELAVIHGEVIENITKKALSIASKSNKYSGSIESGSLVYDRFTNAVSKNYGTARTAGKGDQINNKGKVVVNLDTHKEIIEEINGNDLRTHSVSDIIGRRKVNHASTMIVELDKAYFKEAETAATAVVTTGITAIEEKLEAIIQSLETLKNDYVEGIDRAFMVMYLTPKVYGMLRNYIDKAPQGNVGTDAEALNMFHGVEVHSNVRQTEEVLLMVKESMAQPANIYPYDAEKIPLSNDIAGELFYDYGTKAISPDLIKKAKITA